MFNKPAVSLQGVAVCPFARFRGLLSDLFPGTPITDATNAELEACLHEAAGAKKMELTKQQVLTVFANRTL